MRNKKIVHLDCTLKDCGYDENELNEDNNPIFNQFKLNDKKIVLQSLTSTKYNIEQSSLYFY